MLITLHIVCHAALDLFFGRLGYELGFGCIFLDAFRNNNSVVTSFRVSSCHWTRVCTTHYFFGFRYLSQNISYLCDLTILFLHRTQQFFHAVCQQLLNLLLKNRSKLVVELIFLFFHLFLFSALVFLHVLQQFCKLEYFLALKSLQFQYLIHQMLECLPWFEFMTFIQEIRDLR